MIRTIMCDKCGHSFSVSQIKPHTMIVNKEEKVLERYFRCPKCRKKYSFLVFDPEVDYLIKVKKKAQAEEREKMLREKYKDVLSK